MFLKGAEHKVIEVALRRKKWQTESRESTENEGQNVQKAGVMNNLHTTRVKQFNPEHMICFPQRLGCKLACVHRIVSMSHL